MPPAPGVGFLLKIGNAQQAITLSGGADTDTYELTYGGQTTGTIAKNASAATIQADLVALSSIGAGNVAVAGPVYGPFTVTFQGALAGQNVALLVASGETDGLAVTIAAAATLWVTLGGQKSATFNRGTTEADATSKDSSGWHTGDPMVRDWSIDCEHFLLETDAAFLALQSAWMNNAQVLVEVLTPAAHTYTGTATITKFDDAAPHDNLVAGALTVKGSGLLTLV